MKAEGVEILFAYPVNPLIEAAAEEDIRTVIVRQERTGLHMADAYSRMSSGEKFGVFCMQHGPGSENAFGGVAQAFSESSPILVVPGGYPRHLAHYYPNFNSTLNMRHITKWAEPLTIAAAPSPTCCAAPSSSCATAAPARCCSRCRPTCGTRRCPTAGSTCRASPPGAGPTRLPWREAAAGAGGRASAR